MAYADDVVLMSSGKFLDVIGDLSTSALKTIQKWARTKGLNVNPNKTETVLFSRKYKIPDFKLPEVNATRLALKTETKFLVCMLDEKLSWKPNLEWREEKALKAL